MRGALDNYLRELQENVMDLGGTVQQTITGSVDALRTRNIEASKQIVKDDAKVDAKRFEIEEKCLSIIVTQQPVASDLRIVIAVLNIITELERMADHAEGIGRINLMMGEQPLLKPLIDIPRMSQKATDMLARSLDAFITRDAEAARLICAEDDEIDHLWDQVYQELLAFMIQDPKTIERATYLIWVGHNLERIADRVTNICERVVYAVTGKMEEIGASKY
ncbi:MAG: phosphate signaling complex protein PhoU [Chloroflexi bacterium]|nr:phosphate signaling complex protein PhoU [Chloroflexota bacterium]